MSCRICWIVLFNAVKFSLGPQTTNVFCATLRWRHNGCDSVSNHQPHHYLLNRLFRRRSKITSKLRVTGLCAVNSPGTGEFSAQMASNAEKVSIWWRHHGCIHTLVPHICVSESGHHWFRSGIVAYSAPSRYLNQCRAIVTWTLRNKLQWNFHQKKKNHSRKRIWKYRLQNGDHLVQGKKS